MTWVVVGCALVLLAVAAAVVVEAQLRAANELIEHIRNGGHPDPYDDVAVLLAMLRDDGEVPS